METNNELSESKNTSAGKGKTLDMNQLNNIAKNSEVTESKFLEEQVIVRKYTPPQFKSFSLSLTLEEYNKFMKYLLDNNIRKGSDVLKSLMREKGII